MNRFRTWLHSLSHRPAGRLPVSTYVGYGAGQIGGQILRDTPALILPIYMTTVLGMEAALAGLVIMIAKVWVVAADPIAGVASDKTVTRWGRRRPYILAGGLIAAACFILLFFAPDLQSQLVLFLYMTAIYLVLNTGYSMFSVPYLTLASEMSDDPRPAKSSLADLQGPHLFLLVAPNYDVYSNAGSELTEPWRLGNLRRDGVMSILDTLEGCRAPGLKALFTVPVAELARRFGRPGNQQIYHPGDLKDRWTRLWAMEHV